MKKHLFTIINAVGCLLLLGVVLLQWRQNELQRHAFRNVQKELRSTEGTRDEALDRAASLSADIADLKTALTAAQKSAEESALAQKAQSDQLATLTAERDQLIAQRDAQNKELTDQVTAQVTEWQEAIKKRDATIKEQNALIEAQRLKLNEAIAKLKQAGAR
jgi:septal ring factor EnvC (AmiA/AmiB activator)